MKYALPLKLVLAGCLMATGTAFAQSSDNDSDDAALPGLDEMLDLPDMDGDSDDPADRPDPAQLMEEASSQLASAVQDMNRAARRLHESVDPGLTTQRLQEQILKRLDAAIEAFEKATPPPGPKGPSDGSKEPKEGPDRGQKPTPGQQPTSGGQQPNGQEPNQTGGETSGTPPAHDAGGELHGRGEEWGQLPPRVREELEQGLKETYSSVYRGLTEAYYRQLAEEQESR